jgi:hypothetical protein
VDGKNYLAWAKDVKIKLDDMSLDPTIAKPKLARRSLQRLTRQRCSNFCDTISTQT